MCNEKNGVITDEMIEDRKGERAAFAEMYRAAMDDEPVKKVNTFAEAGRKARVRAAKRAMRQAQKARGER